MSRADVRHEDQARQAVARALGDEHDRTFARRAGIDNGTLGDFLAGRRWPQRPTRAKIEKALDWPIGRLEDIATGSYSVGVEVAPLADVDVLEAIRADPRLQPAAKAHLLNQYELLLHLQQLDPEVLVEQRRRREAVKDDAAVMADEQSQAQREIDEMQGSDDDDRPASFTERRRTRRLR